MKPRKTFLKSQCLLCLHLVGMMVRRPSMLMVSPVCSSKRSRAMSSRVCLFCGGRNLSPGNLSCLLVPSSALMRIYCGLP